MADKSNITQRITTFTSSFLEKATTLHFFMLMCAAFFTLDGLLVCFFGKNILSLEKFSQIPELTIINSIIFVLIFSFLMAVALPLLNALLGQIIFHISYVHGFNWMRKEHKYDEDYADPLQIRAKALREQNSFYLEIAESSIREQRRIDQEFQAGFAASTLFLSNVLISSISKVPTVSLVAYDYWKEFPSKSIQSFGLFVLGLIFCSVMISYLWMSLGLNRDYMVYLPSDENKNVNRSRIQPQSHK